MRAEQIEALIEPAIKALGCQLWGLQLMQSKRSILRIYIDTEKGAGIEDCEKVSRQVSRILDVEDPILGEYVLEVSSPGMDRPLFKREQFVRFSGAHINLRLRIPFEGQRNFKGLLSRVEGDDVVLHIENEELFFPIEGIEKANVVPQFEDAKAPKAKPSKGKPKGKKLKSGQ